MKYSFFRIYWIISSSASRPMYSRTRALSFLWKAVGPKLDPFGLAEQNEQTTGLRQVDLLGDEAIGEEPVKAR
jgi:hypothetical protein